MEAEDVRSVINKRRNDTSDERQVVKIIIPNMRDVEAADLEQMGAILPEGKYRATIADVETQTSQQGNEYLRFTFVISMPADHAGRKITDNVHFTQASLPISKAKLAAIGYVSEGDREFNPGDFQGRSLTIRVGHRAGINKDGLPRTYMDVTLWEKAGAQVSDTAPAPVVIDDDIPF